MHADQRDVLEPGRKGRAHSEVCIFCIALVLGRTDGWTPPEVWSFSSIAKGVELGCEPRLDSGAM